MDRGLKEVDDLLNTKGRLSGRAQAPLKQEFTEIGYPKLPPSSNFPSVTTAEIPTKTSGGARGQREAKLPTRSSTEQGRDISARGTGAHAASVLISATAPADSVGAVYAVAHHPINHASIPTQRALGGSSRETLVNGGDDAAASTDHEVPNSGEAEPTRGQEVVQSYPDGARPTTPCGVNGLQYCSSSPARRRAKEVVPFIKVKGVTLTYAQAKLFGLAGSPYPGASCTDVGLRASHANNSSDTSWRGSGSKRPESNAGGTGSGTSLNGNTHGGRSRRRKHRARARTYSPSRMDALAQPIPGRARVNDAIPAAKAAATGQGGEEASFTWKRSRKAEAAMRWATKQFYLEA